MGSGSSWRHFHWSTFRFRAEIHSGVWVSMGSSMGSHALVPQGRDPCASDYGEFRYDSAAGSQIGHRARISAPDGHRAVSAVPLHNLNLQFGGKAGASSEKTFEIVSTAPCVRRLGARGRHSTT